MYGRGSVVVAVVPALQPVEIIVGTQCFMPCTPPPPAQNERPPATIAAAALPSLLRSARSTRRRHHRSPRPLVQLDREVVPADISVHMPATLDVQRRTARSRQRASCPAGSSPKVPHTNVSSTIPRNSISSPDAQQSQRRITIEHHTPLHPRDCSDERQLGVNSA
jgi:hypothetical protein